MIFVAPNFCLFGLQCNPYVVSLTLYTRIVCISRYIFILLSSHTHSTVFPSKLYFFSHSLQFSTVILTLLALSTKYNFSDFSLCTRCTNWTQTLEIKGTEAFMNEMCHSTLIWLGLGKSSFRKTHQNCVCVTTGCSNYK